MALHPITELPGIRETIKRYSLAAAKSLGQNFLFDLNITDKIVRAAGSLKDRTVLEVGPGPGGLTRSILLGGAAQVIALEKDTRCVKALNDYLVPISDSRLTIIEQDALTYHDYVDFPTPIKIIANLPYNVGTELLIHWLSSIDAIASMTLMFQKEVAERIVAQPGTKTYGRLSVLTQWLCHAEKAFDLPPTVFYPPPKVHSAVIHLEKRDKPLVDVSQAALEAVCKAAFGQRRKTLRASLKPLFNNAVVACEEAGINSALRPEQLSVEEFCHLAQRYEKEY
jgi:16S rRNA (adenine1518-N6/adenine1519-N6)-dimethyltransferase